MSVLSSLTSRTLSCTVRAMQEEHAGRLFDHVGIHVRDVEASRAFYAAVLEPLGIPLNDIADGGFSADELFVGGGGTPSAGLHLAFQADRREVVDRFHAAALAAGATDNGAPGERAYHPGYYAAYALDPDGNNVEAVYHGPVERSAPSVVLRWSEQ
jgi:catechol 2,3-dioxygenase-like lactoylglutathione lyase family enzyme